MSATTFVLLPGLDGTGTLFAPFREAAPAHAKLHTVVLPNRVLSYEELAEWVRKRLPSGPLTLIAESFSGPLGLALAARHPDVEALALCATFVTPPGPACCASLPDAILAAPPPAMVLAALLTGFDLPLAQRVRSALRTVPPRVVAARIRSVLRVDARALLRAFCKPLLLLGARHDRLVGPAHLAEMTALAPHARVVTLDTPHLVLQAAPREAWAALHEAGHLLRRRALEVGQANVAVRGSASRS